jgi:hypothetical protein
MDISLVLITSLLVHVVELGFFGGGGRLDGRLADRLSG